MDEKMLEKLMQMQNELMAVRSVLWDLSQELAKIIKDMDDNVDDLK